jgi:type I restriction-modification system DNA methylase subunit
MPKIPDAINKLVENFEQNLESFKSQGYNEATLRQQFINPFFEALGWDMQNKAGIALAYSDVIHEDAIKIGGSTKAPDYCFRIGGTRKFFLEAKKPAVDIKGDVSPAYQLRRYAWSAKLPLSILTDFEEFAVYDCQIRPNVNDKPSTARIFFCTYKDYADKWEQIANIFSKDAVLKGLFDKYASEKTTKKGTTTVDKEFLAEIEGWRDELAKNIAIRNSKLSVYDLNFAVQKTIDRILFLRICEDRGIERSEQILGLVNGSRIYPRLFELFEKADEKYNSGIFHFRPEKERPEGPDELSANLKVDDDVLKKIIRDLYYPCPYEFSIMPAEILGNVYEQFLGKVIRLTASHQAKVEEKPEVKKAGGVYYTPSYIVDYIVKNTVGKLCEGKTPKQIEKIKILDPACGSGSFLIGAYQYLLDYHRDWYAAGGKEIASSSRNGTPRNDTPGTGPGKRLEKNLLMSPGTGPGANKPRYKQIYQGKGGQWFLTIDEKKRILLNNIYGVDIDSQATEVTKLSLLLKVLENETQESLKLFHERALPDLGANIKCGNSLIGPDFYKNQQMTFSFDEEQQRKINAFEWQKEFATIFKQGGFDAVIGNPPYIPIESMSEQEKKYYQSHHSQLQRKYDSSIIFVLSMLKNLKANGLLGFISSITWQTGENYGKFREYLFSNRGVERLLNLPFDVFKSAYVDTGIYVLANSPRKDYLIYRFPKKDKVTNIDKIKYIKVPTKLLSYPDYKIILEPKTHIIFSHFINNNKFTPLGNLTISTQGLAANRFKLNPSKQKQYQYPFLSQGQVYRYILNINHIDFTDMNEFPSLKPFYDNQSKILIRRVINRQDRLMAAFTDKKLVFKKDVNPFILQNSEINHYFLLAILNSKLISYLYINTSSIATKDDFRQTTLAELRKLPIRTIDFKKPNEVKNHDKMVSLVEEMLELNKKISGVKNPNEKTRMQRQIDSTD